MRLSGPQFAGGSFLRLLFLLPRVRRCLGALLLFLLRLSRLLRGSIVFAVLVAVVVVALLLSLAWRRSKLLPAGVSYRRACACSFRLCSLCSACAFLA
jgi:hypothetical protein